MQYRIFCISSRLYLLLYLGGIQPEGYFRKPPETGRVHPRHPARRPDSEYLLEKVVTRITLAGAIGLGIIAVLPFIAQAFTNSQVLTIGGTGLLIVVSVALETLQGA